MGTVRRLIGRRGAPGTATTGSRRPVFDSFGKVLGVMATLVGIAGGILAIHDRATRPNLEVELVILYTGWEASVRNVGATAAKQVRLAVIAWRNGGVPAADVRRSYSVRSRR